MDEHTAKKSKLMYYLGWIELILVVALVMGLSILSLIEERTMPPTLILRALIILPFGLWWGIRQVKKNRGWNADG